MRISPWLARRTLIEMLVYLGFWLIGSAMLLLYAFSFIPAFLAPTGPSTYDITRAGGIAFMILWLLPPALVFAVRRRAKAELFDERTLNRPSDDPEVEALRQLRVVWVSGAGTALLIFGWLLLAPFVLVLFAIIAKVVDPERALFASSSPYLWLGIVILLGPVALLFERWMRSRRWVAAEMGRWNLPPTVLTRGGRFVNAWVAVLCFLTGAAFLWAGLSITGAAPDKIRRAASSDAWPKVDGVITTSELQNGRGLDGKAGSRALIRYTYRVNGTEYVGSRIAMPLVGDTSSSPRSFGSVQSAVASIQGYPLGSGVLVSYDPANPAFGVLVPGITPVTVGSLGVALVITGGVAVIFIVVGIAALIPLTRKSARAA